jgi:proliferating cell nuclear antigen PCNA
MRLIIENKSKLETFVGIFQLLKNWSSHVNMQFEKDKLYIQSIDKSHICFANIEIKNNWFSEFDCSTNHKISVDSTQLAILMSYALKHNKLELKVEEECEADKLCINFLSSKENKGGFEHFFELNLIDVNEYSLEIPNVDYDVEFTIPSKKLVDVLLELNTFGSDLNIKCSETLVELNANGDFTKLKVNIPIDDLDEYVINEGEDINLSFSLNHLSKMCTSMKLSSTINVSLSLSSPMLLKYNLGDDSNVSFFIAPKISDTE